MKKIGFVIPWFSENITGGAESELKGIVEHLVDKGVDLEVLTTCVEKFNSDWGKNYWPDGIEIINNVLVRRFKVRNRNASAFDAINIKLMNGQMVRQMDQQIFMKEFVNSPDLYKYINDHKNDYSQFVYIPYMFSTNYYGILQCPEKSVVIPCFHEEAYIHMDIYKKAFENCAGLIYLSYPEYELANNIFNLQNVEQEVIGAGVDTDFSSDPDAFRAKFDIHDPFILYAGRKDVGKNIYLLIEYYAKYMERHTNDNLKLVLIGGGEVNIPDSLSEKIIDLGYVDLQDKHDACAACTVLCQPSVHESFSIVIMEGWLGRRPVMVHDSCAVTKDFCKKTNGGLWFSGYYEFEKEIQFFRSNEEIAHQMGCNGRKYVLDNFSWPIVTNKLISFFKKIDMRIANNEKSETN